MTPELCIELTALIGTAGVLLDSFEILSVYGIYRDSCIFGWPLKHSLFRWWIPGTGRILNYLYSYPVYRALLLLDIILCLLVLLNYTNFFYLLIVIACIRILSTIRNGFAGSEAADHMLNMVLVCCCAFIILHETSSRYLIVYFIAAQAVLAYFSAGVVKAVKRRWIEGDTLRYILSTSLFRNSAFVKVLCSHPTIEKMICRSVVLFECCCPLLVFISVKGCLVFLSLGVIFHVSIAIVQGLNLFPFAFISTYPAILFMSVQIHR